MSEVPAFLRKMLVEQYGGETADIIFSGYNAVRPVTMRVNTLKSDVRLVERFLSERGIAYSKPAWSEDAFVVEKLRERDLQKTELYERGEIYLQSLSSMLPPLVLEAKAGENVLDMTAAPGGKTTQIAALTAGKAFITACERDKIRAERLAYNVKKLGAGNVTVMNADASKLDDFFRFDRILLDAPCSGSGTLDLRYPLHISEKLVANCVQLQEKLLLKALQLLPKGKEMVYSTCSLLKQENEALLRRVLPRGGGEIVPLSSEAFPGLPALSSGKGTLTVLPDEWYEGFFLAKIKKAV